MGGGTGWDTCMSREMEPPSGRKVLGVYIDVSQGGGMGNARMCIITEIAGKVLFQPLTECVGEGVCKVTGIGGMTPDDLERMMALMYPSRKIA